MSLTDRRRRASFGPCSKCGKKCRSASGLCRKCWVRPADAQRERDRARWRAAKRGLTPKRQALLDHLLHDHGRRFTGVPSLTELEWIDRALHEAVAA